MLIFFYEPHDGRCRGHPLCNVRPFVHLSVWLSRASTVRPVRRSCDGDGVLLRYGDMAVGGSGTRTTFLNIHEETACNE